MKITLNYTENNDNLGYAYLNRDTETLCFYKLEIFISKMLVEAQIEAEVVLHEINEAEIADAIGKTLKMGRTSKLVCTIAHNLNAESLGEFKPQLDLKTIFTYRNSDRLANIDGKRHKKLLEEISERFYLKKTKREQK